MNLIIHLLIFITTITTSQQKPLSTAVVKSAWLASSYSKQKHSFAPFKEIKGVKGKYRFKLFKEHLDFETATSTITYVFESSKLKHEGCISISAHDKQGNYYLTELVYGKVDGETYSDIDIFELDRNRDYKTLIRYVVDVKGRQVLSF